MKVIFLECPILMLSLVWECKKRKVRSYGIRRNGNIKHKNAERAIHASLKDFSCFK